MSQLRPLGHYAESVRAEIDENGLIRSWISMDREGLVEAYRLEITAIVLAEMA